MRVALIEAARHRQPVEIGYQLASGAPEILVVGPLWVNAYQMHAQDQAASTVRVFDVGRVLWVEAVSGQPRPHAESGQLLELARLERDYAADTDDESDDVLDGDGGGGSWRRITPPGR